MIPYPACDYCLEGNIPVDGWHTLHDPEGIEGDVRVPCAKVHVEEGDDE